MKNKFILGLILVLLVGVLVFLILINQPSPSVDFNKKIHESPYGFCRESGFCVHYDYDWGRMSEEEQDNLIKEMNDYTLKVMEEYSNEK